MGFMDIELVTGGAGFIGSNLVRRLLTEGRTVRVLDNFLTGKRSNLADVLERIELIEGDLRNPADVARAVEGVKVVYHQAALPSVPRSVDDPLTCHQINVDGTFNLLLAAHRAGIRKVVLPTENLKNLRDIPADVREAMVFTGVDDLAAAIPLVIPGLQPAGGKNGKHQQQNTRHD